MKYMKYTSFSWTIGISFTNKISATRLIVNEKEIYIACGVSRITEEILASQEGVYFMVLTDIM